MSNMPEAVGEPLVETLGKEALFPVRLDEMQIGVSEHCFVSGGVPLRGNKLASIEWFGPHGGSSKTAKAAEAGRCFLRDKRLKGEKTVCADSGLEPSQAHERLWTAETNL